MLQKVNTKAELRLRKGIAFSTVALLGSSVEGDGKGGIFFWDNNNTSSDDGHNIIKVNSISVGRWKRATSGISGAEEITEITNILTNDNTFIDEIINNINNSIVNNQEVLDSNLLNIISNLNVEIQDINNKTLFYAFLPEEIPIVEEDIKPEIIEDENDSETCTEPTNVNIIGNLNPLKNSTEIYTLDITGGLNHVYVWTINGGNIVGSNDTNTLEVTWGDDSSLSSVNVTVGCKSGESPIFDFNFFILKDEEINFEVVDTEIKNLVANPNC